MTTSVSSTSPVSSVFPAAVSTEGFDPSLRSIRKRDGVTIQPFTVDKIRKAVTKAWCSEYPFDNNPTSTTEAIEKVVATALSFIPEGVSDIEAIQTIVENSLMMHRHFNVARHYILYREERAKKRAFRNKKPDPKAVSNYIHAGKYARHRPELGRREVYAETVDRDKDMHVRRFPHLKDQIEEAFGFVHRKEVLPSMRSMQFGGLAIEVCHPRQYNCLGRETEFITLDGVRSFLDFKSGDKTVVLTHKGRWKNATVRSYGQQRLFEYRIARGRSSYTVRATSDHTWLLRGGKKTNSLTVKQHLLHPPQLVGSWKYENAPPDQRFYWSLGYVYGDGTRLKDVDGKYQYSMVRLCGDDGRFLERFQELGYAWSKPPSCNGDAIAYTGKYLKTLPTIEEDGFANVVAFVRGYLDADGHKDSNYRRGSPSEFKGIQASDKEAIEFIRKMFPVVGAYISREEDLTGQETNFGVRPKTSSFGLVLGFGDSPSSTFSVQEIRESKTETVWCLEVEDDHSFVMPNGIVTGNCSFTHIDRFEAFSQALYLLLCGCGVGYSVQYEHVDKLPTIGRIDEKKFRHHVVEDTIEGWGNAVVALFESFQDGVTIEFAYHLIRPAGSMLKTSGGRAPGHAQLKKSLESVRGVLLSAQGRNLRPIEAHRIMCMLADAPLSGGIRRSAMLALFSPDDSEMRDCKTGNWFEKEGYFKNANNSAAYKRDETSKKLFMRNMEATKAWGDPGFYFTWDLDYGCNPCNEIGLHPILVVDDVIQSRLYKKGVRVEIGSRHSGFAFCNLTTINAAKLKTVDDFMSAARAATFIGTLQASYTNFPYLGWVSEAIAERDALLGVSMTGMLDAPEISCNPNFQRAVARRVKEWNREFAELLGIEPAARTTCVKPEGCRPWDSLVTTSGGILTLEEMFGCHPSGEKWASQTDGLYALQSEGRSAITRTLDNGEAEVVEIEMNFGLTVRSTLNHPWFVVERHTRPNGTNKHEQINEWIRAGSLQVGDVLELAPTAYREERPWLLTDVNPRSLSMRSSAKVIRQPKEMDDDLAWLFGYIWGDGAMCVSKYRIRFTDGNRGSIAKAARIFEEKFGVTGEVKECSDRDAATLEVASQHLWIWMVRNGVEKYIESDTLNFIPRCVRSSSWRHVVAFAAGLIDSDGCISVTQTGSRFQISSSVDSFASHFQSVMWAVGLGFGRSLQSHGESFQEERHLFHMTLASGPTDMAAFAHLKVNSVKCTQHVLRPDFVGWQMDNDKTTGRQIPGKIREIRTIGSMPTFDVEVEGSHWFYDGAVKSHNTASLELGGVATGQHGHHARRYFKRVIANEHEFIFQEFRKVNPHMCVRKPDGEWVIEFPVEAPAGAILKGDMSAVDFLKMGLSTQKNWVIPGLADDRYSPRLHHNVSITVQVKEDEWDAVAEYIWENREAITGVSLFPSTGDKDFAFAPNEEVTTESDEARWANLVGNYKPVDYESMVEIEDGTDLKGEVACAGGLCEVNI
jgi:hypothetical protein